MAAQVNSSIESKDKSAISNPKRTRQRKFVVEDDVQSLSSSGVDFGPLPTPLGQAPGPGPGPRLSAGKGKEGHVRKMKQAKTKEQPPWFSAGESDIVFDIDFTNPDDIIKKMDEANLTEEETEELLKKAYEINRKLKNHLVNQDVGLALSDNIQLQVARSSAPSSATSRISSDGSWPRGTADDHRLPHLPQAQAKQAVSSGMYSRFSALTSSSERASPAARFTSYPGAQTIYGVTPSSPAGGAPQQPGPHRRQASRE